MIAPPLQSVNPSGSNLGGQFPGVNLLGVGFEVYRKTGKTPFSPRARGLSSIYTPFSIEKKILCKRLFAMLYGNLLFITA